MDIIFTPLYLILCQNTKTIFSAFIHLRQTFILNANTLNTKNLLHANYGPIRMTDKRAPKIWYFFRNGGLGPAVFKQKALSASASQLVMHPNPNSIDLKLI